jgi:hypothetical protein
VGIAGIHFASIRVCLRRGNRERRADERRQLRPPQITNAFRAITRSPPRRRERSGGAA